MSKAISDYSPSSSMVSFEAWPLKVEALDRCGDILMVKCNGKWFSASDAHKADAELIRAMNRQATLQTLLQAS